MWKSKKQKRKEIVEARIRSFREEYGLIAQKYGLDFGVYLKVTEVGIIPAIRIVELLSTSTPVENVQESNIKNPQ